MRRTKIVATVGPSSDSQPVLEAMAAAGMDAVRVPLAHGSIDDAVSRIRRVRTVVPDACILVDLPGPKVRTAAFVGGGVEFKPGNQLMLSAARDGVPSTSEEIGVRHPQLVTELEPGDKVILGDGAVQLAVDRRVEGGAIATVVAGNRIRGQPGVTAPGRRTTNSGPTHEDLEHLETLLNLEIDAVALSFVRSVDDLQDVRRILGRDGPMLVAKIETAEAVDELDAIIEAADAVMIARGDLGMRLALEEVPHIQKRIITAAVKFARPVITATQMLESMISSSTPTRAEVADVAHAVLEGTSALMLSGETAVGVDPPRVVQTMAQIAERAEREFDHPGWSASLLSQRAADIPRVCRFTTATSGASWQIAMDGEAKCIVVWTRSGHTPRAISRHRPAIPIVACTPCARVARQLSLSWGVHAMRIKADPIDNTEIVDHAVRTALGAGFAAKGDAVVIVSSSSPGRESSADTIRLVHVA